jgi:hypothetical protein
MTADERDSHMKREKGQALVRALHLSELESAGAARTRALEEADGHLDRVARLLPNAVGAGISLAEISRITGVSRPTLYELRGRYSDDERDMTLAALQTVASRAPVDAAAITAHLGRPAKQIRPLIDGLCESGLLNEEFNEDPDDPMMEVTLTKRGFDALEHWDFQEEVGDEDAVP